jgi:SAM-dependent methyltransferase
VTDREAVLRELAEEFTAPGRETILYENYGKHVSELDVFERYPAESILDLGGGDAIDLICLRRLGSEARMVLVDNFLPPLENRMGEESRPLKVTLNAGIEVVNHDFWLEPRLPFPDDEFDLITILDVLEHLPGSPMTILEEVRRILKPDGKLVVSGPNAASLMSRMDLLLGQHPYMPFELWTKPGYVSHFREYTPREYERIVEMAGFEVIECEMLLEPTATRAKARYHNGRHGRLSPVTWALWGLYVVERLLPFLRPSVTVVATPRT